jgi:hypothetical protein
MKEKQTPAGFRIAIDFDKCKKHLRTALEFYGAIRGE